MSASQVSRWGLSFGGGRHKDNKQVFTGLRRVVVAGKNVFTVDELVTGRRLQVHVAKMRPYADAPLGVTEGLTEVIARIQGERESCAWRV